jgi:hypothetical protein
MHTIIGHRGMRASANGDRRGMEIPKDQILKLLRDRGEDAKADQADQQLPDQVDPEQHKDILERLGINPADLMGGGLGGLGDKIGL